MEITRFLEECQLRVDQALERHLPEPGLAPQLRQAMRYSLLNGGKRVRPVLVYATATALGCPMHLCDDVACAVELLHSYSLIHDDLPAMDDENLRRGKPPCHIAFDEATAILAGDALQALAFEVITNPANKKISAETKGQLVHCLAQASGIEGMAAGQAIDLANTGQSLSLQALEQMHHHKTGRLIAACIRMGALLSERVTDQQIAALEKYANCIGLAFQIKDDILDVEADTETLGKPQGADHALDKPTYTSILGLDKAKQHALEMHHDAIAALEVFGPEANNLRALSAYIIERSK